MKKGMTGFQLKVIGLISMVFDHLSEFFSFAGIPGWFNWIGRIAAPIFLFESSEGFIHTRNRKKYMLRLLYGFWIMNIINFILNTNFSVGNQIVINNIFSTLFLATVYMQSIEYLKKKKIGMGLLFFILPLLVTISLLFLISGMEENPMYFKLFQAISFIFPNLLATEGGFLLVLLAVLFYIFHGKKWLQIASLFAIALITTGGNFSTLFDGQNYQWMMVFAAIPIYLYNGKKGRSMRSFFYIFYPAHIVMFALLSYFMQK